MVSVFDLEKLRGLLEDFYRITQIRITVFDSELRELVSFPETISPVCQIIRSCSSGIDACTNCDRAACGKAARQKDTYIYCCHAGLTEAVTPLYVSEVLVGYLLFGHVFAYGSYEEGTAAVLHACGCLPIDKGRLEAACGMLPLISRGYVRSATQILRTVASYLILERMAALQEGKLAVQLDAYLSANYTKSFTAQELCAEFGIGKTQLYKLAKELYGHGVAQHIRNLRMERAKALLSDEGGLPIAEIAAKCGYKDYNYFITVFTREVGSPPGSYRGKISAKN